jgi:hypothetical protein
MGGCSGMQSEQVEQLSEGQDDHECFKGFLQFATK